MCWRGGGGELKYRKITTSGDMFLCVQSIHACNIVIKALIKSWSFAIFFFFLLLNVVTLLYFNLIQLYPIMFCLLFPHMQSTHTHDTVIAMLKTFL